MTKPPPNVLDDLLFHTQPDVSQSRRAPVAAESAARPDPTWTPPDWGCDAVEFGLSIPIHPARLAALRAWATAAGLPLRDAVDCALALLLGRRDP